MAGNMNAQAMSEQRQEAAAAMTDSLHAELAERGAIIAHLQEELQQKEHLLQQISMAAAPVPPTALAVAPSPKRPTPGKAARLPRHTPQRIMDGPKPPVYPQKQAMASLHFSPVFLLRVYKVYDTWMCRQVIVRPEETSSSGLL